MDVCVPHFGFHCAAVRLRVEYMEAPIGVDVAKPRFSWALAHSERGAAQTAYRVVVTQAVSLPRLSATVWDSGKVASNRSQNVAYDGTALEADNAYEWAVRYYDHNGAESPWANCSFAMGLPDAKDWSGAEWISHPDVQVAHGRGVQLRTEFNASDVTRGVCYLVGLGYYKLCVSNPQ